MDESMNIQMNSTGTSLDINQIIQLVETLYNSSDISSQAEANRKITELQTSNELWQICWSLLDPSLERPFEVHFFAAQMLFLKISQNWTQLDEDWLEKELRPKLVETLLRYASSPKSHRVVIDRLSLALANFALHSIPTFWPHAIQDILKTFTPQNLPVNLNPQSICDILLKILMYLPEEYSVIVSRQDHRAKLSGQMTQAGQMVFEFLLILLNDKSALTSDSRQNVLKCMTSWTLHSRTSILELDNSKYYLDSIYILVKDDELCNSACAALGATFDSQKADNYRNTVIEFIPKIAGLKEVVENYMLNDEIECAIKVYSLIINFSENHSRLFLRIMLKDGIDLGEEQTEILSQSIFKILNIILSCTSAPGIYGIDEKYSDISFSFWFTFFENFCFYSESFKEIACKTFDPVVDSLLQILIVKARYPSPSTYYQSWNDDQRESYRCYRQDLGDNISLMVQFPKAKERILKRLLDQMKQELQNMLQDNPIDNERPWQGFEALIFALKSISESVPYNESESMPEIFSLLLQIPFRESHALLYCTVAEMISAYCDWLFTHQSHLATAFNILFLGVDSPDSHVRLMSTISLKDLTVECQTVLQPFAPQIVKSCSEAVLQSYSKLSIREKSRLMHTIGTSLAMLPTNIIETSLTSLTMPLLCDLNAKALGDPNLDPTCRPIIHDRLTMLNSLIESLYVRHYSGNDYEHEGDENDLGSFDPSRFDSIENAIDSNIQPSLGLLQQLVPILNLVASKYRFDEELMEIISSTIKRSAKSLGIEIRPLVKDFLTIVVNFYDPLVNSNMLDGSLPLFKLFKVDQRLHDILRDAFGRISDKTLEVCMNNPLRQLSLTIENYFNFATLVCKKFPSFLLDPSPSINVELNYKLAVTCLELPEKRTLTEVCNFLVLFRDKATGHDELHRIFVSHLDVMLVNIFNIFGGIHTTPRNAIDTVSDLLFTIIEADEAKGLLKIIVDKENFPTSYVNQNQKAIFVSKIVHEKNRRKFKELCSEFVMLTRNLNRSA